MIHHVIGNLLEADAEALVNTVNTVGVMGKGVALQFRHAFPENYRLYRKAFERGELQPGRMLVFDSRRLTNPRYIINFPTKRHWKGKARVEDIKAGLRALISEIQQRNITSVAIPPLGCGNGGLAWEDVRPLIEAAFEEVPHVRVLLFAPSGAPQAVTMQVATKRPAMTPGRAAIISLMDQYAVPGFVIRMIEIQKLAYFLQVAGEPMRLNFMKAQYGPYAEQLHHVLQRIEGHFIRGYGDRSQEASIRLLPDAAMEAAAFLESHGETRHRLDRVARLIEGFETPHGMELLATVHWTAQEDPAVKADPKLAVAAVHRWNDHKQAFPPMHIEAAWSRLKEQGWFEEALVLA